MSDVLDASPLLAQSTDPDAAAQASARAVLACVPLLMRALRAAMRQAAPEGLSVPQFRALIFTQRFPSSGVGDLAQHLGVAMPTASAAVSTLVRRGLLAVRGCSVDRRRKILALTPAGEAIVQLAWQRTEARFTEALRPLLPQQLAACPPLLQALAEALLTEST